MKMNSSTALTIALLALGGCTASEEGTNNSATTETNVALPEEGASAETSDPTLTTNSVVPSDVAIGQEGLGVNGTDMPANGGDMNEAAANGQ